MRDLFKMTPNEVLTLRIVAISIFISMALVVCGVLAFVDSLVTFIYIVIVAIFIGILLFCLAVAAIDLRRRGGRAARALKRIHNGTRDEQLQAIEFLHFVGKSAALYMNDMRENRSRGPISEAFLFWQFRRELKKYVLPGLKAASKNSDVILRRHAISALKDIGTMKGIVTPSKNRFNWSIKN